MKISPLQFLRSIIALLIIPAASFVICLGIMVDLYWIRRSKPKAKKLLRTWGRVLCWIANIRVRIEGQNNLDPSQTYIFIGNHASQVDIWSFQGYSPHDFCWIAKKELFSIPILGKTMRAVGFIPLDRTSSRAAMESLNEAAECIAGGSSVLIFPEGTRSPDGHLQTFKTGAIVLAIKAGVPVVPIAFCGSHPVLPKGRLIVKGGDIVLRIGFPMPTKDFQTKDKQKLAQDLQVKVAELLYQ